MTIVKSWAMCKCISGPAKFKFAIKDLFQTFKWFIFIPYPEEASDVCFSFGRLLGSILNVPYVSIWGDGIALEERRKRISNHGCVEKYRYLINGKCPKLGGKW